MVSWRDPRNWIRSRRHMLSHFWDLTDRARVDWAAQQRAIDGIADDFSFDRWDGDPPERFSFLVLGDPGEGDRSQELLRNAVAAQTDSTDFAVILSDVIYPAGRSVEYLIKFYLAFMDYRKDIYAVPGNHDWYDGLTGFMAHFCDQRHQPGKPPDRETVAPWKIRRMRRLRANQQLQPNAYCYIDHPLVRLVGVDTGVRGAIGAEQLEWLRAMSYDDPRPKILLTGVPVYAQGRARKAERVSLVWPRRAKGNSAQVRDIVDDPAANYHLVLGGDTHDFEAYSIPLSDGRRLWHLVTGGAGAYLTHTHSIPSGQDLARKLGVDPAAFDDERHFCCYPHRDDSLEHFGLRARWYHKLWERAFKTPSALIDDDEPPYYRSFARVNVAPAPEGLSVDVFVVSEYDDDDEAPGPTPSVMTIHPGEDLAPDHHFRERAVTARS